MKRHKTYIGVRLIAALMLLALFLVACNTEPKKVEEDKDDLIVVGFSQVGSESSWRVANSESMKAAFSESNGYELIFEDAKQKQDEQYKAIRTFIQQKVDYIVLAPITETGWDDVLQEAKDAGIPVIIVDRQVAVADDSLYTAWVGSNFLAEGEQAMDWLEKELWALRRNEEQINILHIQGTLGATSQLMRTKGLEIEVATHDNWSIVKTLEGEYTEAKAYELTKEYIEEIGPENFDVDVIYSENDNMTFGVMRALDEYEIAYGRDGGVILISFDAVHSALEECLEGKINLCVECNPLHGPRVAELIEALELDKHIPKWSYVEEAYFATDTLTPTIVNNRQY